MGCIYCGRPDCQGSRLACPAYINYRQQMAGQYQANARNIVTITGGGNGGGSGVGGIVTIVSGRGAPTALPKLEPLRSGGMKIEDLIGWRIWRVKNDHLWSYSADYAWMPGDVSEGEPGDHDSTGIWAFKDKRRAFQKCIENGHGYVWGSVRLWGHVVEHKDGYRASKARIISIDGATRDVAPETLIDLCRLYRVPEIEVPAPSIRKTTPPPQITEPAIPFGELPPLAVESKPTPSWPVISVIGGILLACALLADICRMINAH